MSDLIDRQEAMIVIENSGLDDDSKDTVVRVLEQLPPTQPTQTNADLTQNNALYRVKGFPIDADLLMTKVLKEYGIMAHDRLYHIIETMDKYEIPSTQPERKPGKWITVNGRLGNEVECSQCHSVFWCWMGNYKFCPSCGARRES